MAVIYLSLGSNIGDRLANLQKAVVCLENHMTDIISSSIIETTPQYVARQPNFLNQVIMGKTGLSPFEFLKTIHHIESQMGRYRTFYNGPRVIDIDIISYGDLIISTPELIIPHPRFNERYFVLEPLLEIAPHWRCPKTGKDLVSIWKENDQKQNGKTGRVIQKLGD